MIKDFVKITAVLVLILFGIVILVSVYSCDSGWSVAGWEIT